MPYWKEFNHGPDGIEKRMWWTTEDIINEDSVRGGMMLGKLFLKLFIIFFFASFVFSILYTAYEMYPNFAQFADKVLAFLKDVFTKLYAWLCKLES